MSVVPPSNSNNAQFTSASLYVGDLNPEVTEAMLYEIFNSVGPVASIRVCRDSLSRRSLGYAYVNYHSVSDAERALDTLNYTDIKGNAARIMWSHRDPSLRKSGAGNIFVKNLDKTIDNKALYDTFSLFGNILSCKVAIDEMGRSKSYGFVHYETENSAKQAIDRVNGMQIGGKTVYVAPFVRRHERGMNTDVKFTNIYIKNIPSTWSEDLLRGLFEKFGTITSMAVKTDNKQRTFAFINYDDSINARQAVETMNNMLTTDDGVRDDGEGDVVDDDNEDDPARLCVCRHQAKSQRQAMLKAKFENAQDVKARFQGVNLFIKNLDDSVDDDKLREAFEQFGTITSTKVMYDAQNVSRGFGFVCFMHPDEATKAVTEMHLKLMHGKPLYVGLAEKREKRLARLQQRYRVPSLRPGMPASVPPQMQYGAHPSQMYYGGPSQMQPTRPMMTGFQQNNMMPWRPQTPRPYVQQGNMPPQMNPIGMYPQPGMHAMASAGPHNLQMTGMVNRGGPRVNRGGASSMQPINGPKQPTPMNKQTGTGYKFTPQARNRIDHQSGIHPGIPGNHAGRPAPGQEQGGPLSNPDTPLTAAALAAADPNLQKQMLGEKLFPLIARYQPKLAGKITGMMLEMDNSELLILLESDMQLKAKVEEALRVLQQAQHE